LVLGIFGRETKGLGFPPSHSSDFMKRMDMPNSHSKVEMPGTPTGIIALFGSVSAATARASNQVGK
jgi:hypothetical protein